MDELHALAAAIRADDPTLSEDQALDAAAVLLPELRAYGLIWDAERASAERALLAYAAGWDATVAALAASA